MLAWASASECDSRHGVLIASLSSEPLFLMGGSERLPAVRWQPDRPEFCHSPGGRAGDGRDLRHEASAQPALSLRFPAGIIRHAVWLYRVFSFSLRDVELLLAERGVAVSYEAQ